MNSTVNFQNVSVKNIVSNDKSQDFILKLSIKNTRKILKIFLLRQLHNLFCDIFKSKMNCDHNNYSMECYAVDSKIIQLLIQDIIETGDYTLEGIAYCTHIPFDVIYEAACGISNHFSITPWIRIIDLYLQVKPDVTNVLVDKLLEIKNKNPSAVSSLLNES